MVQFILVKYESRMDKIDAKIREGVWLGFDSRIDEDIVGTGFCIYRASTIKGVQENKRRRSAKVLAVVRVPWGPTPSINAENIARVTHPDVAEVEVVAKDCEVPESIV